MTSNPVDSRKQSRSVFFALLPVLFMATYYFGGRAIALCGTGAVVSLLTDLICRRLQRRSSLEPLDLSAVNTGIILAMLLPASAPYWLAAVGAFIAVAVVRHPFGGYSSTLFHPANTAFAFLLICWNSLVTRYPLPGQQLSYASDPGAALYSSPAAKLMTGGAERMDLLDALMGNYVGPMGCTCVLVLFFCGLYLCFRQNFHWQIPIAACAVVVFFAVLVPRVNSSTFSSVMLELISGSMLFCLIFVASIDSGELQTGLGRWLYGLILGGLIVLFRYLSRIEMVTPFAIIIMNAIDHRCDDYGRGLIRFIVNSAKGVLNGILWCEKIILKGLARIWEWISALLQKMVDGPKK
ncbi:MAG: RnfABCDGE type electron transport complex subunit D [Oscillospiraceae bacterium]|nr:RnfABCDGE type electron transport complex subunit D [Oscillospiraceae bacterium]